MDFYLLLIVPAADESVDIECAVHLVSVQQGSDCSVLVWNSIQGSLKHCSVAAQSLHSHSSSDAQLTSIFTH